MPSPSLRRPSSVQACAPFRLLAKAGEAAGRVGAVREDCPYRDEDARSVPWIDGWWQGRRARERAPQLAAAREAKRRKAATMATKRKPTPTVVGLCRLPGCGKDIAWDPERTPNQNAQTHYCCLEHKEEAYRLRRKERAARERAEIAAGTRARPAPGRYVPDDCEAQAARLGAYWSALGYDVKARVEIIPEDEAPRTSHRARRSRRVVSDLVGGKPPGVAWGEVQQRLRERERRLMGEMPG